MAFKSKKERQLSQSDNFRESAINKELIPNRMQRGLRVITLQEAIKKGPILL
jgi:hypothetical protein